MGQKIAAYSSAGAIVAYYDSEDSPAPSGTTNIVEISDEQWQVCINNQGWTVINGALVAPPVLSTAEVAAAALIQSARTALGTGLAISSAGTPTLNGMYAVDQVSQMDIIAIETSINAGKGFPSGATTFNYPDNTGAMHAFSEANFTTFASAVRDYVYALKSVIAGASTTLPAASTAIA